MTFKILVLQYLQRNAPYLGRHDTVTTSVMAEGLASFRARFSKQMNVF